MWTQKELAYLKDLKAKEQLCVDKYRKYAEQALDPALKALFESIGQVEQHHVQLVEGMLNGQLPQQQPGAAQPAKPEAPAQGTYTQAPNPAKQQDAYLCQDAIDTEKLVAGEYETAIFEFCTPQARDVLNRLQRDEQQHGEALFQYMQRNAMVRAV